MRIEAALVLAVAMSLFVVVPENEVYNSYLPLIKIDPTRTPTPKPLPTPTRTATPAALPTVQPQPMPTSISTRELGRRCDSSSADWRGNGGYPFCVARDMGWVGQSASVQYRYAGSGEWLTAAWDFYGAEWYELRLENNSGIASCETRNVGTGQGGFRLRVGESGSHSFNVNRLARGLYKLEMYVWAAGREFGHNEVFICIN